MARTREDRLTGKGPKRILAIDAGGARALLGAGLLFGLEAKLRRERNDAQFRLWDHFDLIGGVSSGAVLAAALSAGASVEEACVLLEECGPSPEGALRGDAVRRPKFDQHRLQETLQQAFGGALLGDPRIRTGLAILV
ncbi:MAG: patatin-like phospholipase family protein, partial [Hyphomonadaceae bacterium]|nr:patatin-like phospholipase family protein [Hyphomonadaceae bacterium]